MQMKDYTAENQVKDFCINCNFEILLVLRRNYILLLETAVVVSICDQARNTCFLEIFFQSSVLGFRIEVCQVVGSPDSVAEVFDELMRTFWLEFDQFLVGFHSEHKLRIFKPLAINFVPLFELGQI